MEGTTTATLPVYQRSKPASNYHLSGILSGAGKFRISGANEIAAAAVVAPDRVPKQGLGFCHRR